MHVQVLNEKSLDVLALDKVFPILPCVGGGGGSGDYNPNTSLTRSTASSMQPGQERRIVPVSMPFKSPQMVAPFLASNASTICLDNL